MDEGGGEGEDTAARGDKREVSLISHQQLDPLSDVSRSILSSLPCDHPVIYLTGNTRASFDRRT